MVKAPFCYYAFILTIFDYVNVIFPFSQFLQRNFSFEITEGLIKSCQYFSLNLYI